MAHAGGTRDERRAPRVDVLMRVQGHLAALDTPVHVHDLSQTGFAVVSRMAFQPGETLDFRLVALDGSAVSVTARAVHSRAVPGADLHLSGFQFLPGAVTGLVPRASIDRLIAAVTQPQAACF